MKLLVVGDPHIKVEDLDEGQRFVARVRDVAMGADVDRIVFMGDLFHSHSIMHVEVMHFWRQALVSLRQAAPVIIVLGNHDGPHDMRPGVHALASLTMEGVQIIDQPTTLRRDDGIPVNIGFVPFMRSNEEFVATCREYPIETLYCHQEFDGCRFENGLPSPYGVKVQDIPQKQVISGHIHMGQEFGKIWYVGAPRWLTASDANQDRFIWVIEHDDFGAIISRERFATDPACQRIVHLEDTPEKPADPAALDASWKAMVDIRGPAAWVEERKALWRGKARYRTFRTGDKRTRVRESDGIPVAFQKYLEGFQPRFGTPQIQLKAMAADRLALA